MKETRMHYPYLSIPDEGMLTGKLLVATPAIADGCFGKSVIFVCAHNDSGAMGVIVNHAVENVHIEDIFSQLHITMREKPNLPVHFGGPVEPHRGFILHTSDQVLDDSVVEGDGIALTANIAMLKVIALGAGPQQAILCLGYAGWGAGQLESEIEGGSWIVVPSSRHLVFDADNDLKWHLSASGIGVDITRVSPTVGHA